MSKTFQVAVIVQLSVVLLFAAPGLALAGEGAGGERGRENSLTDGAWSIQFGISDEFALRSFNSMGISVKRQLSPRSAYRIGANIGLDVDDLGNDSVTSESDTVSSSSLDERNASNLLVQLDLLYMRYANPDAEVNFFFGTGPLIRFERFDEDRRRAMTSQGDMFEEVTDRYQRTWRIGAIGVGGVEWFATRSISIHAEYRMWLSYGRTKTESETTRPEDPDYSRSGETTNGFWDFHGNKVTFGVSLYF